MAACQEVFLTATVAQICNLLYRRLAVGRVRTLAARGGFQIRDTADCKSAPLGCGQSSLQTFSRRIRRGPRMACSQNVPPLPDPLLHPVEEREFLRLLLCRGGDMRGFIFATQI